MIEPGNKLDLHRKKHMVFCTTISKQLESFKLKKSTSLKNFETKNENQKQMSMGKNKENVP